MTGTDLEKLRPELGRFLGRFRGCFSDDRVRGHFRTFVSGQLGPLPRKSLEPIADWAGMPPRTLQEFMSLAEWNEERLRDRVREIADVEFGPPRDYGTIGILDETSFAKKGDKTACVQRQYCGCTGKVDNCVQSIHLSYANGDDHVLIDSDLYLPESWDQDRARCRAAGIPDDVVYRPFYKIAIEEVGRAHDGGIRLDWITADERYGRVIGFLEGLENLGKRYVLEVPTDFRGWCFAPTVWTEEPDPGRMGPPRHYPRVADGTPPSRTVAHHLRYAKAFQRQPWLPYHIKDTENGPEIWEVKVVPFYQDRHGLPFGPLWLVVARNVLDGQVKFFAAHAPPGTPLEVILWIAFSRWHVERCFEDEKDEIGMDHFEVRKYGSIRRQLFLSMVSYLFLALQRRRLRGEKSGRHRLPDENRHERLALHSRSAPEHSTETTRANGRATRNNAAAQHRSQTSSHTHEIPPTQRNGVQSPSSAVLYPASRVAL